MLIDMVLRLIVGEEWEKRLEEEDGVICTISICVGAGRKQKFVACSEEFLSLCWEAWGWSEGLRS